MNTSPQLGGDLDCNGAQIQWSKGADVASDTALAVLTDGNYFDVTGTTTITSINTTGGAGTQIKLHFDGALTFTHDSTDLILPGGANITTAAGDEAELIEYASGDYRCTSYTKADGTAVVLANNSITLAKMAGGTDGNIISYDASGDPVAIATGNDGQVLTSSGANTQPAFEDAGGGGLTIGTEQATTSGTSFAFTGIPTGTKMIVINFDLVSLDGADDIQVQIGDAGGLETSGYLSASSNNANGSTTAVNNVTTGFHIRSQDGNNSFSGNMILTLQDSANFEWCGSTNVTKGGTQVVSGGGSKALSAELTQLSILDTGSSSFDAGAVNILYF
jgi:hypothetical protein